MHSTHDVPPAALLNSKLEQGPARIPIPEVLIVGNRTELKNAIVRSIDAGRPHVILEASRCTYVDSSGLGVLIVCNRRCRDAGGSLVIFGLSDELRAFFEISKMDTVLTIAPRDEVAS